MNESHVRPGLPHPLGVVLQDNGANVAVFSEHATAIDICLFGEESDDVVASYRLPERSGFIWHGWIDGIRSGTRYALRAHGVYDPALGQRFNDVKLLVDPYAVAIGGPVSWSPAIFGYDIADPDDELAISMDSNNAGIPRSLVVDRDFDWQGDTPPAIPLPDTVIYEAHVKGLTMRHPDVPESLRGTYLGACHPPVIEHLRGLGVTAIEFLPIHEHIDDHFVVSQGLTNYWGYSTLGFMAPHHGYATASNGEQVAEFKEMVRTFHQHGIEVILDVVYNHTCEGNQLGPTLSFRGLDNISYYHLLPTNQEYYLDFTGTGNSLRAAHPQVLTLILDSLRYWVSEMHVDGFRFDLATTLGRDEYEYRQWAGVLDAIHQDPLLTRTKLIAEPWDIGEGGYQVGNFPIRWSEWNDKFRDDVRAFWLHGSGAVAEMGYRLSGSSDIYELSGRGPMASINLVTAHDGFTLRDLVSYDEKHNDANGEGGQDGHGHNLSANHGAEGETDDPLVNALRLRQQRNLLATLFLAQGVPMLLGGDEFGRTQQGNNNAYCQDNEISWFDWSLTPEQQNLLGFCQHLLAIRRDSPILRRRRFFKGRPATPGSLEDISWFRPDGERMSESDWAHGAQSLGLRLAGDSIDESDQLGGRIDEPNLTIILHAGHEPITFVMPEIDREDTIHTWEVILDTGAENGQSNKTYQEFEEVEVPGRTVLLLRGRAS